MFTKEYFRTFFMILGGGHTRFGRGGGGKPSSNELERHCGTLGICTLWCPLSKEEINSEETYGRVCQRGRAYQDRVYIVANIRLCLTREF
jgi:hypothetical protein